MYKTTNNWPVRNFFTIFKRANLYVRLNNRTNMNV